jgi:hypothetical protein
MHTDSFAPLIRSHQNLCLGSTHPENDPIPYLCTGTEIRLLMHPSVFVIHPSPPSSIRHGYLVRSRSVFARAALRRTGAAHGSRPAATPQPPTPLLSSSASPHPLGFLAHPHHRVLTPLPNIPRNVTTHGKNTPSPVRGQSTKMCPLFRTAACFCFRTGSVLGLSSAAAALAPRAVDCMPDLWLVGRGMRPAPSSLAPLPILT